MGDLIEPAFRRAQDSAKEQLGTPLEKEPDQTVTFWLVRSDDFERAVAEGIRSYLDDPEVREDVRDTIRPLLSDEVEADDATVAANILQSIGAKGVE